MTNKALKLSLVIPGLLGPFPPDKRPEALPALPGLETLLGKATTSDMASMDLEALLFHLFDIPVSPELDLPVAAVSHLTECDQADSGYWLKADPVHLMAQQDKVYLVGHDLLPISMEEATQLTTEFNALYAEDGWQLQACGSHHWYLRLPDNPLITTTPLANALGFDIGPLLPGNKVPRSKVPGSEVSKGKGSQGEKDLRWHGIMNEIQMLLHGSHVNQAREARGEAVINGLWLWGGGELPEPVDSPWQRVWSDDNLGQGLATLTQTASAIPNSCDEILSQQGSQLLILDSLRYPALRGDMGEWSQALDFIEADWLLPLFTGLQSGRLAELTLYPVNGQRYTLSRSALRRWWRRCRSLSHYLQ